MVKFWVAVHQLECARLRSALMVPAEVIGLVPPREKVPLGEANCTEVTVPAFEVRQVPLTETQPPVMLMPLDAVVVPKPNVKVPKDADWEKRLVDDAVVEKKLVEVAEARVVLPVKALVLLKVLAVVVEKAVEKMPVDELYAKGYVAESEEELILLLKVVQSAEAR